MSRVKHSLSVLAALMITADAAFAHFLWLVAEPAEHAATVNVYFSESASPDDPALLDRVAGAKAWSLGGGRSKPQPLTLKKTGDALVADVPAEHCHSPVVLRNTYGVIRRGGEPFLLNYYAKTYPSVLPGSWRSVDDQERLPLEVVPRLTGSTIRFEVRWNGAPAAGATITVSGPGLDEAIEGETNAQGTFQGALGQAGLYSVRARLIEESAGEHAGDEYASVRHYSTLTFRFQPPQLAPAAAAWPPLGRGVTSFGGALAGDWLYVYGGHYGEAHHYSREGQSGDFLRLNLRHPDRWEPLAGGPKLTGVSLVAHQGQLYRVGGFTAKNSESEDQSLWSQDDFARFDPRSMAWESLAPLPDARSSHDAAVLGDTLYVVGGWSMQGDGETQWCETAWSVDLRKEPLKWTPIAEPPFRRRAMTLAAHNDKLYVLGGMQEEGGPTTRVAIYDPSSNAWSQGPALLGSGMEGFGSAAFACGGRLFATTMSGSVQRLMEDGGRWEFVAQLANPRFFHRMLPWRERELVIVGGAHMSVGKIDQLERLPLAVSGTAAK